MSDKAFKFDVPGLDFNDKQFIEIRLTGSGLQLSEFTDTHKIIAGFNFHVPGQNPPSLDGKL